MTAKVQIQGAAEAASRIPERAQVEQVGEVTFSKGFQLPGGRDMLPGVETVSFVIGVAGGVVSSVALSLISNYIYDRLMKRDGEIKKISDTEYVIHLKNGGKVEIFISE